MTIFLVDDFEEEEIQYDQESSSFVIREHDDVTIEPANLMGANLARYIDYYSDWKTGIHFDGTWGAPSS